MAGFSDIIGHEQIIGHLKNAIALDKVSHAYIFNGPKLSGKMMLAEAFAMALQCEGEGTRPCLLCRSCKQAVDHNQPDIIYVSHEKPNTIGVDDIRTQINNDIVIKPYSSRYKVYIVDEAEKTGEHRQRQKQGKQFFHTVSPLVYSSVMADGKEREYGVDAQGYNASNWYYLSIFMS